MSKVHPEGEASETHTVRTSGRRPEPPGRAEGSRAARESAPDAWRVFCPVHRDLPAESGKPGTRTARAAALAQSSRGRAPRAGCRRGPRRRCPLSPAGRRRPAAELAQVPADVTSFDAAAAPPRAAHPGADLSHRCLWRLVPRPVSRLPWRAATARTWASTGTCLRHSAPPRPPEGDAAAATRPEGGRRAAESPGPRQIAPRVRDRGPSLLRTSPAREAPLPPGHGASPCAPACAALDTGLCGAPASGALAVG